MNATFLCWKEPETMNSHLLLHLSVERAIYLSVYPFFVTTPELIVMILLVAHCYHADSTNSDPRPELEAGLKALPPNLAKL